MEVTTANNCSNSFSVVEWKKDKAEFNKNVKFFKNSTKEAMTISKAELVEIIGRPNLEEKRNVPFTNMIRRRFTLIEL